MSALNELFTTDVKTVKDVAAYNRDWMYVRAAAIARHIYIRKDTGIGGLRKHFGGAPRGQSTCKSHHTLAAGKIIRHVVQQLEKLGWVESCDDKGGRKISKD